MKFLFTINNRVSFNGRKNVVVFAVVVAQIAVTPLTGACYSQVSVKQFCRTLNFYERGLYDLKNLIFVFFELQQRVT